MKSITLTITKKRIETEVMELNTGIENFKSEILDYENQIANKEKINNLYLKTQSN